MRLRGGLCPAFLFALLSVSACTRSVRPAASPAMPAIGARAAEAPAASVPSGGTASTSMWSELPVATLLDRSAPKNERDLAFAAFHRDTFERIAAVMRRADSKGADTVVRGLCTYSFIEGASMPVAPSASPEWQALRATHRADGDEASTLALLDMSDPASEALNHERDAVLAWVEGAAARPLVRAGRRSRVALERAGLCPSAQSFAALDDALHNELRSALDLRDKNAVMTPENTNTDDAREALRAFTVAPVGLVASKLAQGDLQGAKALVAEPSVGAFVHPAIVEVIARTSTPATATDFAALALTLRIVVERDTRHRDEGIERLVEVASARLAREAQVLQPTAPETTLLAARVLGGLALGALGVPMLGPVAVQSREHEWLREALVVSLGAEGEAAGRADRRDVERIVHAARPVLEAVVRQSVPVDGVEVWRASAMAAEAALRDGDGTRAEALFREPNPTPPEVAVPLARLEAAADHPREALARLDAMPQGDERSAAGDKAVAACEIASFANTDDAGVRCLSALDMVLGARALWASKDDGKNDRLLARILVRFDGGFDGAMRALERAYNVTRRAGGDVSFVIGQAIGAALVTEKPDALGPWIDRALDLDADDLVYFGAWAETLLARHGQHHDALTAALRHVHAKSPWVKDLAAARLAHDTSRLVTLAKHDAERAEAAFYIGLEHLAKHEDTEAKDAFRRCRSFRALDLMEHSFSEALLSAPARVKLPVDRTLP